MRDLNVKPTINNLKPSEIGYTIRDGSAGKVEPGVYSVVEPKLSDKGDGTVTFANFAGLSKANYTPGTSNADERLVLEIKCGGDLAKIEKVMASCRKIDEILRRYNDAKDLKNIDSAELRKAIGELWDMAGKNGDRTPMSALGFNPEPRMKAVLDRLVSLTSTPTKPTSAADFIVRQPASKQGDIDYAIDVLLNRHTIRIPTPNAPVVGGINEMHVVCDSESTTLTLRYKAPPEESVVKFELTGIQNPIGDSSGLESAGDSLRDRLFGDDASVVGGYYELLGKETRAGDQVTTGSELFRSLREKELVAELNNVTAKGNDINLVFKAIPGAKINKFFIKSEGHANVVMKGSVTFNRLETKGKVLLHLDCPGSTLRNSSLTNCTVVTGDLTDLKVDKTTQVKGVWWSAKSHGMKGEGDSSWDKTLGRMVSAPIKLDPRNWADTKIHVDAIEPNSAIVKELGLVSYEPGDAVAAASIAHIVGPNSLVALFNSLKTYTVNYDPSNSSLAISDKTTGLSRMTITSEGVAQRGRNYLAKLKLTFTPDDGIDPDVEEILVENNADAAKIFIQCLINFRDKGGGFLTEYRQEKQEIAEAKARAEREQAEAAEAAAARGGGGNRRPRS